MMSSSKARLFSLTKWEPYLFLSPWLIGFVAFMAFPICYSLWLSFCEWDMMSPKAEFVGVANYVRMFADDPHFLNSLRVTTYYALGSVPLGLAGSLALAMLLNRLPFGTRFFRTAFFLPAVVSGVAVAVLWMGLFNPEFGFINYVLSRLFGLVGIPLEYLPKWLLSARWALPAIIIMSLWGIGPGAIIFLAGLQSVPNELHEAARIDGANGWQRFRNITVPLLTPMILFNLIMGLIGSFQVFTQGYIMTNGGPREATLFLVLYIWQRAFGDFQAGYASAMAWVLFLIILLLTLVVLRSSKRWVHYGGEA